MSINLNKLFQKKLKNYIKNNENNYYNKKELKKFIENISKDEEFMDQKIDYKNIVPFFAQYLHYSTKEGKFYFNLKEKQIKSVSDYIQILCEKDNSFSEEEDIEYSKGTKIKKTTDSYQYPSDNKYNVIKRNTVNYGPFGTQWIHDIQVDDLMTNEIKKAEKQFLILKNIKSPKQRTDEWYKIRYNRITASDCGCVLNLNIYEPQYSFILKKTIGIPFKSNEYCYHGKKFEGIAIMIYEYRMNVRVTEFGLIPHPKYDFLGASPDGICSQFKYDNIHRSKFVGRMLEIKCPLSRKLIKTGDIIDNICPIYYYAQIQLQLECCDLNECDFWQCDIQEYSTREEFINDTDSNEPFRSKQTGFEKGCLIQLIPKDKINDVLNGKYLDVVYEHAIFIYPPKIEMTPYECDIWISNTLSNLNKDSKYNEYVFDKIIFWRLRDSVNVTIKRDTKWFETNFPKLKQMWDYVLFFRKNKDKLDLLIKFIESLSNTSKTKKNDVIMDVIQKLYHTEVHNYNNFIKEFPKIIENNAKIKQAKEYQKNEYMFVN